MKVGFALPVSGSWATPGNVVHVARRAEELGYHSLWTFQRLLSDVDGTWGEMYRSVSDPLVTLGYVAALTERIRLGVAVVNLPFTTPVQLAKQAATLDILSGGRLDLGVGLGWADQEYVASGTTKQRVGRRAEEFIAALKTLWTDEIVQHEGEFYQVPPSRAEPKPVQSPHPPILIGGAAPAALRRAGRIADGWVSSSRVDPRALGESVAQVRQGALDAGRDPDSLRFICRGVVKVRPEVGAGLTGPLDHLQASLPRLADQGITEVFIDLNFDPEVGSPDADPAASRARADEVLTAFAP